MLQRLLKTVGSFACGDLIGRVVNYIRYTSYDLPVTLNQERALLVGDYLKRRINQTKRFNVLISIELRGKLRKRLLRWSILQLMNRHQALRSVFLARSAQEVRDQQFRNLMAAGCFTPGSFICNIRRRISIPLKVMGSRDISTDDPAYLEQIGISALQCHIDGTRAPLRVLLVKLSDTHHVLFVTLSHLIADEQSLHYLIKDLSLYYRAASKVHASFGSDPTCQLAGSAEQEYLRSADGIASTKYWLNKWHLFGAASLPLKDLVGPARTEGCTPASLCRFVEPTVATAIRSHARSSRASTFALLMSCLFAALYQMSSSKAVAVWINCANRAHDPSLNAIGWFANTHIVATEIASEFDSESFLTHISREILQTLRHQRVPTAHIWNVMGYAPKCLSQHGSVLVDYLKSDERAADADVVPDCVSFSEIAVLRSPGTPVKTLDIKVLDSIDRIRLTFTYNRELISTESINLLCESWVSQIRRRVNLDLAITSRV